MSIEPGTEDMISEIGALLKGFHDDGATISSITAVMVVMAAKVGARAALPVEMLVRDFENCLKAGESVTHAAALGDIWPKVELKS